MNFFSSGTWIGIRRYGQKWSRIRNTVLHISGRDAYWSKIPRRMVSRNQSANLSPCLRSEDFSGSQPANQRPPLGGPARGGSQSPTRLIKALFTLERVVQCVMKKLFEHCVDLLRFTVHGKKYNNILYRKLISDKDCMDIIMGN
jgi:hypothetical protein